MLGLPGQVGGVITVCRFRNGGIPGQEEQLSQVVHGPRPLPMEGNEGTVLALLE